MAYIPIAQSKMYFIGFICRSVAFLNLWRRYNKSINGTIHFRIKPQKLFIGIERIGFIS
ncbi:MAG: hypothetical protein SOT80_05430 [Candidatus Pseudoruminococcus sp.]|nr:hypothetical protein [Ruminococcus sp.]MDY2782829.1 hypothetical protein [Candidatus Pseudoruminococcus sp.]